MKHITISVRDDETNESASAETTLPELETLLVMGIDGMTYLLKSLIKIVDHTDEVEQPEPEYTSTPFIHGDRIKSRMDANRELNEFIQSLAVRQEGGKCVFKFRDENDVLRYNTLQEACKV
jgi:hypothetical protein